MRKRSFLLVAGACLAARGAPNPGPALNPLHAAIAAGEDAQGRQHWQVTDVFRGRVVTQRRY